MTGESVSKAKRATPTFPSERSGVLAYFQEPATPFEQLLDYLVFGRESRQNNPIFSPKCN
jgi:hypothetical protein